ncbi:MAG: STM4015 family protein, partial [Verrucomicrobiota bacterium]
DGCSATKGIIIGAYDEVTDEPGPAYAQILDNRAKLPNLKGLFLGEATGEESEISWIEHEDVTEFLNACPGLEDLRVRGNGISIQPSRHISLKRLVFESGGLPSAVIDSVAGSVFPEMEHLEIYCGTENYGWDGSIDNLKPLLENNPFPKLKYLGLRNCEVANELAAAAANAPVLDQIETLDLSLGNMQDEGGQQLLASEKIKQLKKLDLHHHYFSDAVVSQFLSLGIEVDVSDQSQPDIWEHNGEQHVDYYISVTE